MDFDFEVFWQQLLSPTFAFGALLALSVATVALVLSLALGYLLALGRASKYTAARGVSAVYIWLFRALPALLVLVVVWNALPQLIPALRQDWYSPFWAAVLGLTLVEAAYMAEIVRAALLSVDEGQPLAGRALGMKPVQVTTKIVFPQAFRVALPPLSNEFIGLIKFTSLASVISLRELMTLASAGVANTFRYTEFYSVAAVYYLVIVSLLMMLQRWLEKKVAWTNVDRKRSSFLRMGSGSK
ncbi:amino acid ABC transporter permease [Streptomyces sp. NPDC052042]|uniref:amino acid ABC transporter permease n=1 Tax=Streptomyces sp. NPDC052042 TaxID=3365683 RepID=UPI0037CD03A8